MQSSYFCLKSFHRQNSTYKWHQSHHHHLRQKTIKLFLKLLSQDHYMVVKRNREKDQEKWKIKEEKDTKRRKEKEVKAAYTQL